MSTLSFSNIDEVISFLRDPENDRWNPYMTIDSFNATLSDGKKAGIPSSHYQELNKVLEERRVRIGGTPTCSLF